MDDNGWKCEKKEEKNSKGGEKDEENEKGKCKKLENKIAEILFRPL